MPTEVLVMCTRCGRPQAARKGNCVACGEVLPDAPMPAAPGSDAPFLLLEGTGGRAVTGVDRRLTYRAGASAAPVVVELGNLQGVVLVRRLFLEALTLVPVALILALIAPASLRPVAAGLAGLGVAVALLWRRYSLGLRTIEGGSLLWPLGLGWIGSRHVRGLDAAWSAGAQALASRGVTVTDAWEASGPRA